MSRKYLDQIALDGLPYDLWTRATLVEVVYNGEEMTLADALAAIYGELAAVITPEEVDEKVSTAIGHLINGAPETGDTLKELFDLIGDNKDAMRVLNEAIGGKVDKVSGKGLSTEDFTTALKNSLNALLGLNITSQRVNGWDAKAETTPASQSAAGLMSSGDKKKLDGVTEGATKVEASSTPGKVKINGVETTVAGAATQSAPGLMSKEDKAKLDGQPTILVLAEDAPLPAGLADGTIVIRGITVENT